MKNNDEDKCKDCPLRNVQLSIFGIISKENRETMKCTFFDECMKKHLRRKKQ